jgi:predicted ATPase/DNA-binding CsgD family transcriptional regulator
MRSSLVAYRVTNIRGDHVTATDPWPRSRAGILGAVAAQVEISEREAEILQALRDRLTNAEIAKRYFISVRTVETHVSNLLRKYGVADRRALATAAISGPRNPVSSPGFRGLPVARTPLIGRGRELDAVNAALDGGRLVTLVGPGGVGKTRLATRVVQGARDGAFIDLVPVSDAFVIESIAAVLGVSESPGQPLDDAVLDRLSRGETLLVLDNCEHVINAVAGLVERVLNRCPQATILATSREQLDVPGEQVIPLGPLRLASEAEELFAARARAVDPEFTADPKVVALICQRLDGMPLAIELAAARSASLGAAGLLAALDDQLRLLRGGRGVDERHRSLRDVIGWSYQLLDNDERGLFRALGVFAGGFDLAAVIAVAPSEDRGAIIDLLGRLTSKSLVTRERSEYPRWRLLETVRVFAADELSTHGEREAVRQRHRAWAASTASRLARAQAGREAPAGGGGAAGTDSGWREEFDLVVDDLRAALAHCPQQTDVMAHQLARMLGTLTYARRFLDESIAHYRRAATLAPDPAQAAADLNRAAASVLMTTNLGVRAAPVLVEAADRARQAGDGDTEAILLGRAVEVITRFSGGRAVETARQRREEMLTRATGAGNPADPRVAAQLAIAAAWDRRGQRHDPDPELARQALTAAQASDEPLVTSAALDLMATVAVSAGRLQEAHRISMERANVLARLDRDDPLAGPEIVDGLHMAVVYAIAAGDLPTALSAGWSVRDGDLTGSHPYAAASKLVIALALTGDVAATVHHADEMHAGWRRAGGTPKPWLAAGMLSAAFAEGLRGDLERSGWWREQALIAAGDAAAPGYASFAAFVTARLILHIGEFDGAVEAVDHAFADFPGGRNQTYAQAAGAELAVAAGLPAAAVLVDQARPAASENHWADACLARAEGRLNGDPGRLAQAIAMWERLDARAERAVTLLLLPDRAVEGRSELAAMGITLPGPG